MFHYVKIIRLNQKNFVGVFVMNDPTFIKYSPVYDLNVEVAPPPPPKKQTRIVKLLFLTLLALVLFMSITATWLYFKNDQSTVSSASAYTAADLVKDFRAAHLKFMSVYYGTSIDEFTSNLYNSPITSTSSVHLAILLIAQGHVRLVKLDCGYIQRRQTLIQPINTW